MGVDSVRNAAIGVLLRVFERDAYLNIALDKALRRHKISERSRRFLTQLVYGTVRHKLLCDFVLEKQVHQPLDGLPHPILAVLRMGVFQSLFCAQVTHPAMVHTSVDLARKRGHAGTARLVNAVLRRVPQSVEEIRFPDPERDRARYLSVRYSMPQWLVERWLAERGRDGAEALCEAYNAQAPVTLRANTLKTSPEQLVARLTKTGWVATQQPDIPEAVTVLEGPAPARSKLFQQGHFMLEDAASMLPPHLLEPQAGELVLDMCAAPGVKTTHLAQLAAGRAEVVAMDVHPAKLRLIQENVGRLGMPGITVMCGDGIRPPVAPGFSRVLVDAPCSGLGTLRRRPDLKWRVGPELPAHMAVIQQALLRSAIELCKNGGVIVYSVCTFFQEETDEVVEACLAEGRVEPENGPDWLAPWNTQQGRYRTDPQNAGLDGFFLTRLRKVS